MLDLEERSDSDGIPVGLEAAGGLELEVARGVLLFLEVKDGDFWVRAGVQSCSLMEIYSAERVCLMRTSAPKTTAIFFMSSSP